MKPEDLAAANDQRRARELQHVTVLLEGSLEADGASGCLRGGPAPAAFGSGKQDAPPVGAFETHGPVALELRVRNADGLDTVTAAEARHFRGCPLHHAAYPDATFGELREDLTQLRESFRIEGSTEMPEPEDERRAFCPELGEGVTLAGCCRERKFGSGIADGWRNLDQRFLQRRQLSYCGLRGRATGSRTRTAAEAPETWMRPSGCPYICPA